MSAPFLLLNETITTALTAAVRTPTPGGANISYARRLTLHANFTYGSGGTNATAYVQTSLDGGTSWFDIASFQFTTSSAKRAYNLTPGTAVTSIATPTDGTLTANTSVNGFLGDRLRVKITTTGTYAGTTTFAIHAIAA